MKPWLMQPNRRRPARRRAGSVLILVVALLVLLALIGTAWISTARTDLYAAQQHSYNTQIELLVESATNLVNSAITSDLHQGGKFRPATADAPSYWVPTVQNPLPRPNAGDLPTGYENSDSPWRDAFLADRIPANEGPPAGTPRPFWRHISGSPFGGGGFETPYATLNDRVTPLTNNGSNKGPFPHSQRIDMEPSFLVLPSGKSYPALHELVGPYGNAPGDGRYFLAGDADGDGVADSALWPLPIGPINGVKYYVASRVIDNNSAVNASVAWQPEGGPGASATIPAQFFPTNVNLLGMIFDPTGQQVYPQELRSLNAYRFNRIDRTVDTTRVYDVNGLRNDLTYLSEYDTLWNQLGRRLKNPGRNGGQTGPPVQFQALSPTDSAALARKFIIADPNGSPSLTESLLPLSTWFDSSYNSNRKPIVPYTPYDLTDNAINFWFRDNFNFDVSRNPADPPPQRWMPQRSVLTTWNPVSNFAPSQFLDRGDYVPGQIATYQFGDLVRVSQGAGTAPRAFVRIAPQNLPISLVQPDTANPLLSAHVWAALDSGSHPTKVSVNTGSFGQLYSAYWNTMVERHKPGDPFFAQPTPDAPFLVNIDTDTTIATVSTAADLYVPRRARMFRTPIRDPNLSLKENQKISPSAVWLTPHETLQLRAALAAVNTIDLRDGDNDITSRTVYLSDPTVVRGANDRYVATVYGSERQPYLTELYVNNDKVAFGADGFVAMELYNPSETQIDMIGWRLAVMPRTAGLPAATRKLTPLDTLADAGLMLYRPPSVTPPNPGGTFPAKWDNTTFPRIPGRTHIIIANTQPPPGVNLNCPWYVVPALRQVYGNEVYLLRPRNAGGLITQSLNDPANVYDEQKANNGGISDHLQDYVPVESADCSAITPQVDAANATYWHTGRPSGLTAAVQWGWVFPGKIPLDYNIPVATETYLATDTQTKLLDRQIATRLGADDVQPPPLAAALTPLYSARALQIAADSTPDRTKITGVSGNRFPFGGFARNGDILHVPFIGAYRIQRVDDALGAEARQEVIVELNTVSVDSVMAEDLDPSDDLDASGLSLEQIGRFCPINPADVAAAGQPFDDYSRPQYVNDGNGNVLLGNIRYGWALDLFDNLTVQDPQNDYFPNVDPGRREPSNSAATPPSVFTYPLNAPNRPEAIGNENAARRNAENGSNEEAVGVQGLVNVNTAPVWVLRQLPLTNTLENSIPARNAREIANRVLAADIVRWRDGRRFASDADPPVPNRPMRSLFELNLIPQVIAAQNALISSAGGNPGPNQGDISPDAVVGDFEHRYLMVNRLSNFLTTRSDTFTVYIQVQGWRDVGGDNPEMVVQRRVAYIADRTGVTPLNPNLQQTPVPLGD